MLMVARKYLDHSVLAWRLFEVVALAGDRSSLVRSQASVLMPALYCTWALTLKGSGLLA